MDKPRRHYVKWKEARHKKIKALHVLCAMWNGMLSKQIKGAHKSREQSIFAKRLVKGLRHFS